MAKSTQGKPVWGLDIGGSAIKGVKMRLSDGKAHILAADILPLQGEAGRSDSPGRDRRIWQGLRQFAAKYNLRRERVAIGLPGPVFFTRPFDVPQVPGHAEEELVRFEVDQHIPFGLDAVLWDYELFPNDDPSAEKRHGLLFAMKKEVFNNYLLSCAAAEIEPVHVQAAPLALMHFVKHELDLPETALVVDIGAAATNFLLFYDRGRYAIRSINSGVDALTSAIQRAFASRELSREDAEAIKVNLSKLSGRAETMRLIEPAIRTFAGELSNAVRHLSREHHVQCDRVFMVGGGASMYGLPRLAGEAMKARVITPAGLGRIEVDERADLAYVNANLPSLAPAIGLGLQALGRTATNVNLVGATLLRRKSQTVSRRLAASAVAAALLLVLAFGTFASVRKGLAMKRANDLRNVLAPLRLAREDYRKLSEAGEAEKILAEYEGMAESRDVWSFTLDKVTRMLPDNQRRPPQERVWLKRFSLEPVSRSPGLYRGTIEAGGLLRADGSHRAFAENTLVDSLANDPSGVFKNAKIDPTEGYNIRAPSLYGRDGPPRFWVMKVGFTVDWKARPAP